MQQLECESHSLGLEDENLFNSPTSFVANRTSSIPSSTSSVRGVFGASVGATASANVEETASWVDRPTATGQTQQGTGVHRLRGLRWNGMGGIAIGLLVSILI